MTFNKTSQSKNSIVFERESQAFSNGMKIFAVLGVAAWILLLVSTGVNTLTMVILVGLFLYIAWVVYADQDDIERSPRCYTFLSDARLIQIEMDDKDVGYIPYSEIDRFDLEIEQRSPINANSIGVNYIHYHVNVVRKNGGVWTITSSTKRNESEEILKYLRQHVPLPAQEMQMEQRIPSTVSISGTNPVEVKWSEHQALFIHDEKLIFENREKQIRREFPLFDFIRLSYSYSDAQESNSIIIFYFRVGVGEMPFKMTTKLNPVECLQLESLLHRIMQKKLSA